MHGQQERTGPLFSNVPTEERIPKGHPSRQVRRLTVLALWIGSTPTLRVGIADGRNTTNWSGETQIGGYFGSLLASKETKELPS